MSLPIVGQRRGDGLGGKSAPKPESNRLGEACGGQGRRWVSKILHRVPFPKHKECMSSFFPERRRISEYLEDCPRLM